MRARAVPLLTLLGAVATAAGALALDGLDVARLLTRHGSVYGPALWWVLAAPLPLAAALAVLPRTPWPWVVVATAHLGVLVATATRLRLLLPGWSWAGLALVVAAGVAGIVTALRPVASAT